MMNPVLSQSTELSTCRNNTQLLTLVMWPRTIECYQAVSVIVLVEITQEAVVVAVL